MNTKRCVMLVFITLIASLGLTAANAEETKPADGVSAYISLGDLYKDGLGRRVENMAPLSAIPLEPLPQLPPVKNDHTGKRKPVPQDLTKRCPQWEPVFEQYGLLPVETWSYIAWRESRCRIKAINIIWDKHGNIVWALNSDKSYDSGLLQINSSWKTVTRQVCGTGIEGLMILDCNLRVARHLMENTKSGLGNWRM